MSGELNDDYLPCKYPKVEYSYKIDEKSYSGDTAITDSRNLSLLKVGGKYKYEPMPWREWKANGDITVYYNPDDPY